MEERILKGVLLNEEIELERVPKGIAHKLFETGSTIITCPHKMDPFNKMTPIMDLVMGSESEDFNKSCDILQYHYCDHEWGRYLAFYKKKVLNVHLV